MMQILYFQMMIQESIRIIIKTITRMIKKILINNVLIKLLEAGNQE